MTAPAPAHRVDRLRRAWKLVASGRVERVGPGQFRVAGNVEDSYYVDLASDQPCTCLDLHHREQEIGGQCKHRLAARLANHDPALLLSLIELMQFVEDDE